MCPHLAHSLPNSRSWITGASVSIVSGDNVHNVKLLYMRGDGWVGACLLLGISSPAAWGVGSFSSFKGGDIAFVRSLGTGWMSRRWMRGPVCRHWRELKRTNVDIK